MAGADRQMFWLLVRRALRMKLARMLVVFAALTVGAAIVCAMAAVYFDINAKMSRELRTFGANFYVGPGESGGLLDEDTFNKIVAEAPPGLVSAATPYLYGTVRTELQKVVLAGVNFEGLRPLSAYWQVDGDWISVNFDDRNALLGVKLAEQLEARVGREIILTRDTERKKLRVKGIVEAGDTTDRLLIVNLPVAQEWLRLPGKISHALLRVDNGQGQAEVWARQLRQAYPELDIKPIRRVSAAEGQVLEKIKGLMGLVALVILVLSTLCVNTTLTAIVNERATEFALQKALGAKPAGIVLQIVAETALTASAAIVSGGALGFVLAQILGQAVFASSIEFRAPVLPLTAVLSLLVALVAVALPIRRAVQMEPARILKGE
ncbi:MAG: ABC transporter permease [Verrucomicrobiales bacterium]|jgi:putative ABC transport system permease protein|nr:ABC transporter permease [Verrucomicrobiales bacterium]